MKRIFCIGFISIIFSFSFLTGFFSVSSLPVYAVTEEDWQNLSSNDELVDAFRAYCKERDLTIEGSFSDAVTSCTSQMFFNITNVLGIDLTALQAEIQKYTPNNGPTRYLLSVSGISTYNRIFAQFLQDYELSVGQSNVNEIAYSGDYFTDYDGYKCLVYYVDSPTSYAGNEHTPLRLGTSYKYSFDELCSMQGQTASYTVYEGKTFSDYITPQFGGDQYRFINFTDQVTGVGAEYQRLIRALDVSDGNRLIRMGHRAIFNYNGGYYFGHFLNVLGSSIADPNISAYYWTIYENPFPDPVVDPVDVNIVSPVIKPDLPTSEPIIIYYPDDSEDDPDSGDDWNPVLPDVPPSGSDPSGGNTIDWPDLDLPDFDLPNFSLGDLRLKFPFSIPFDIVSILGVVNAPAVAPVIQEDIPIRIDLMNVDYTIPINLDMSDSLYDNFAVLVRAVEFIGFCIGLIHLTIRLVKG